MIGRIFAPPNRSSAAGKCSKVSNLRNPFPKSMPPAVTAELRAKRRRAGGPRDLQQETRRQLPAWGRLPGEGHRGLAGVRRPPGRALDHLRTSNPLESVFATVSHRTVRTTGALSPTTAKLMVLVRAASKTWRKLMGANQLPRGIEGVTFTDGVAQVDAPRPAPPDQSASPKSGHSSMVAASSLRGTSASTELLRESARQVLCHRGASDQCLGTIRRIREIKN